LRCQIAVILDHRRNRLAGLLRVALPGLRRREPGQDLVVAAVLAAVVDSRTLAVSPGPGFGPFRGTEIAAQTFGPAFHVIGDPADHVLEPLQLSALPSAAAVPP